MKRLAAPPIVLVVLLIAVSPVQSGQRPALTFAQARDRAIATLMSTYYVAPGQWRACDAPDCPTGNIDWGYDSLTYSIALAAGDTHDPSLLGVLSALAASAPSYPAPCAQAVGCTSWSDVPVWDAIALADEYLATGDAAALTKAQAAYQFVAGSSAFALGACSSIPYQQPGGAANQLKTLETEGNAIKAALLLYRATGQPSYLASAVLGYEMARRYFLDPDVPLYTVYVFDDGRGCRQLPHRFFASVNGDMIWSGVELAKDTGDPAYLAEAVRTARAVDHRLSDARGVFADLQAENDIVEPLVEGMTALAQAGQSFARDWLLRNAAVAMNTRTADGSFGRFFDGPPPVTTVTAWQTNGGLALEIAAAEIAPTTPVDSPHGWAAARLVPRRIEGLPATIRFRGDGIALLGTLGARCCEHGHARVLIDGRPTTDGSGIWQNKSSSGRSIAGTILFAWRWRTPGLHTITVLPGERNAKEGGPFLQVMGYDVLHAPSRARR